MRLTLGKTLYLLLGILAAASLLGNAVLVRNTIELSRDLAAAADKAVQTRVAHNAQELESGMRVLERTAQNLASAGEFLHSRRADLRKSLDADVKTVLTATLAKAPKALGAGLWFEPGALYPEVKFYGPYAFRKDGQISFTWDLNTPAYNYFNQAWYRLAIPKTGQPENLPDGFTWTDPYFDEAGTKSLMITADALMHDASGRVIGMATIDFGLDKVRLEANTLKVSHHAQAFVSDASSGSIIAWTGDAGMIGKRITELPFGQAVDTALPAGQVASTRIVLAGDTYALYYTVTPSGTVFGALAPTAELFAETDSLRQEGLAVAGAVAVIQILIFVFLVLVARRRVSAPLTALAGLASRAADGDLAGTGAALRDMAGDDHGQDEVGTLVAAFSRMVANLSGLINAVQSTGINIASSSTSIAASAASLEEDTGEHASAASQVLASSREIAAQSEELLGTVDGLDSNVAATATTAREGRERLVGMRSAMNGLLAASTSISERLAAINDKAKRISDMVTTVSKISEQTNVLSLNASIEAEKAGEYGRGFSVVAREIRRLADRAAAATVDIEGVVGQMHSAVASGVMGMEKFTADVRRGVEEIGAIGEGLEMVIAGVGELGPQFSAVREAMRSQSAGAGQITEAMERLVVVAARTRDSITEFGRAVDELNGVVRSLRTEVSRFHTED